MHVADYIVLFGYFLILIGIGVYCMRRIKHQEDYLMGGRGFGKLLQTFAAFGAGTGSSDPINTARNTYTGGMSGMWSVMFWLFVTPFYWITAVWYRRMRHLTLGDWYVERYESKKIGAAYSIFGVFFFMIYGSMFFTAIATTAEPMIGETVSLFGNDVALKYVLIPTIAIVVVLYGMAGGLAAAYYTDLLQGICIIALSIMLIPIGLNALNSSENLNPGGNMSGPEVMHDQLPESFFEIIGSSAAEFSFYYLVAIIFANLVGIVVQPHFIATGGGSAKSEQDARVGLVVGNFLKRFCTLGWVFTALIAAALYADVPELIDHPDRTWGYASMQLLGPGFRGLMLACLLAALMSSVDAQMVVGAGLILRNLYMPFIRPTGNEKEYLWVGRVVGVVIVGGSVLFALTIFDMLGQLQLTFWFPLVFAAPFWLGMYWRRATTTAAWITVTYCLLFFFVIPFFGPKVVPGLRSNQALVESTIHQRTTTQVLVSKSDLRRKHTKALEAWSSTRVRQASDNAVIEKPHLSQDGAQLIVDSKDGKVEWIAGKTRQPKVIMSGGKSIYWDKVVPREQKVTRLTTQTEQVDKFTVRETLEYPAGTELLGEGNLKLNLVLYKPFLDMKTKSGSSLNALELVPKIIMPFLVMIICCFLTRPNSQEALDRYYAKMKTPVDPDPEKDQAKLAAAYADPGNTERVKLFPNSNLEFQKPTTADIAGFVISVIICFAIIGFAFWMASIGMG
ncbi:MAG: sodium:solute symporter family protein [Pirellulaceae bacterium]